MTDRGKCRSCKAPVVWVRSAKSGKPIPLDPPILEIFEDDKSGHEHATIVTDDGRVVCGRVVRPGHPEATRGREVHKKTCPDAEKWRKKPSKKKAEPPAQQTLDQAVKANAPEAQPDPGDPPPTGEIEPSNWLHLHSMPLGAWGHLITQRAWCGNTRRHHLRVFIAYKGASYPTHGKPEARTQVERGIVRGWDKAIPAWEWKEVLREERPGVIISTRQASTPLGLLEMTLIALRVKHGGKVSLVPSLALALVDGEARVYGGADNDDAEHGAGVTPISDNAEAMEDLEVEIGACSTQWDLDPSMLARLALALANRERGIYGRLEDVPADEMERVRLSLSVLIVDEVGVPVPAWSARQSLKEMAKAVGFVLSAEEFAELATAEGIEGMEVTERYVEELVAEADKIERAKHLAAQRERRKAS